MKKSLPFLAVLALAASSASAQTTWRLGMRGGLNRALTTVDPAGNNSGSYPFSYSTDKSAIYAWQAGLVLEANLGKFALQPALLFSQKGEKGATFISESGFAGREATEQTSSTNRYNWLELPLNVVYTLQGDHGLQLFAGPYVALAVGGRQAGTTLNASPNVRYAPVDFNNRVAYGSDTNNRRLDVGVNVGVGYRQGPVQVQLGYELGLRNLHQAGSRSIDPSFPAFAHDFKGDAAYNRVAQLTGTYFFSL